MHENRQSALLEEMDSLLRSIGKKYQQSFLPYDSELSAHQVYFLKFLARRKTCTPSDISQEFGITLGAVTGFVDRLHKLGLISRSRSEEDRRLVLIELTDKGREQLLSIAHLRDAKYERLWERIGEQGLLELNTCLKNLKAALDD